MVLTKGIDPPDIRLHRVELRCRVISAHPDPLAPSMAGQGEVRRGRIPPFKTKADVDKTQRRMKAMLATARADTLRS